MTTGAANDIEQATNLARSMVTRFGMSKKFGLIGLESIESQYLEGRAVLNCSDATAAEIDQEVMRILKECYQEALELLSHNREVMDKLAAFLIEKETITGKEFMKIYYREIKGLPESEEKTEEKAPHSGEDSEKKPSEAEKEPEAKGIPGGESRKEEPVQPKPWEQFEKEQRQAAESRPSEEKAQDGESGRWTPPTPGPEARYQGPVGRFSGAVLRDDDEEDKRDG